MGVASKDSNRTEVCTYLGRIFAFKELYCEMLRAQPPNMLQTMSNSQEIALISKFLEDLGLTRAQVLFSPYFLTIQGRSSLCP